MCLVLQHPPAQLGNPSIAFWRQSRCASLSSTLFSRLRLERGSGRCWQVWKGEAFHPQSESVERRALGNCCKTQSVQMQHCVLDWMVSFFLWHMSLNLKLRTSLFLFWKLHYLKAASTEDDWLKKNISPLRAFPKLYPPISVVLSFWRAGAYLTGKHPYVPSVSWWQVTALILRVPPRSGKQMKTSCCPWKEMQVLVNDSGTRSVIWSVLWVVKVYSISSVITDCFDDQILSLCPCHGPWLFNF